MKHYECYPSYGCNSNCVFCFTPLEGKKLLESRKGLSTKRLAQELYGMHLKGCASLSLLGGEPTVRPDLVQLCSLASKIGYKRIFLFTNGTRLSDRAFTRRLRDAGLTYVNMSVHGHTSDIHDALTRVPGAFVKVLRAIDNILSLGIGLSLICVLNKMNAATTREYFKFFTDRGVKNFQIFFLRYQGQMSLLTPETRAIRLSMSEAARLLKPSLGIFKGCDREALAIEHFVPCVLRGHESSMRDFHPGGLVELANARADYACIHPEGKNESILDLAYKNRIHLDRCGTCALRAGCAGIEEDYMRLFGDKEFQPIRDISSGEGDAVR